MADEIGDGGDFGPAMRVLSDRMRRFVQLYVEYPLAKRHHLAKMAGYNNSPGGMRVHAHRLLHDPRILRAIEEETQKRIKTAGLIGIFGLVRLASNPAARGHQKACEALADRAGYTANTTHTVKVEHTDASGAAMLERIRALAVVLGVDAEKLLGVNATPALIEGKVADVQQG